MIKLIILLTFSHVWAAETVIPTSKHFPAEDLKNTRIIKSKSSLPYLGLPEVKRVLNKLVPETLKMSESDVDLFYKSLIHYDDQKFKAKYPFTKNINLNDLRSELHD